MHILAIIPARGGSKVIPFKNIRKLAGKPLIEHTIESAKKSKYIDKLIVTTDNKKIAKIAEAAGAEVPFLRPKKISRDDSPSIEYVKHTLDFLSSNQLYIPDIVLILQPTSPLRTSNTIDRSIEMLRKSNASCILGVSKIKNHPFLSFWYKGQYLKPFKKNFQKYYQRQKFPELYYPTGSIYTFWRETVKKYNSVYGPKIKPMIIDDITRIDIDEEFDFVMCETIILNKQSLKISGKRIKRNGKRTHESKNI